MFRLTNFINLFIFGILLSLEHCFLHKHIFLSVTDICLKLCGQVSHIKRGLLAKFINTYKYIFEGLVNISHIN
jgi:hypothetical protein